MKSFITLALIALVGRKLFQILKQIHFQFFVFTVVAADLKSDLISRGNELIKKADAEIRVLQAAGKKSEVAILRGEEAQVRLLVSELEAAHSPLRITELEAELTLAEARLSRELAKLSTGNPSNPSNPANPTDATKKAALISRGNELIQKADLEIKLLEAKQKTSEVTVLKGEEAAIKLLIADLEAATSSSRIAELEKELDAAEKRLARELAKLV